MHEKDKNVYKTDYWIINILLSLLQFILRGAGVWVPHYTFWYAA
jgi:hypothetical protein